MKHLIAVLLLGFLFNLGAQGFDNPDGDLPSIHVTPYLLMQNFGGDYDSEIYNTGNVSVLIKVPLSSSFTFSPFYEFNQLKWEVPQVGIPLKMLKQDTHKFGVTFSYYLK